MPVTVHGFSSGATCVGLGQLRPELGAVLEQVCQTADVRQADDLAALADQAGSGDGPLVLAAGDLDLDLPAALDLLDSPSDRTAVLLADPRNIEAPRQRSYDLERAGLARVAADRTVESVGTGSGSGRRYAVGNPNRVVVGLLRIRAQDRNRAAELWRAAAGKITAAGADVFEMALLVLVRGGLPITEQPLGYYRWSRTESGQTIGQDGLGATGWDQRLRSASRLGDGAYSAAVVRRLSRLGTRLALRTRLTPNLITGISLAVGIGAGLLIFTDRPVSWVVAAVLLQLALIIDCMDGEVARYGRRYSAFGGWLDGIGDRIKEYLVFAAVGAVAAGDHHPVGWLLAMIAMVVVTARHLEDYAYTDRQAPGLAGKPAIIGLDQLGDGSPGGTRTSLPARPSLIARIAFWIKKIAHVPIAERYLVLSLALLTFRPLWVLITAIAASGFALVWTVGGRLMRALREDSSYQTASLGHQRDLGVLALLAGRIRIPFLPGLLIMIISWLGVIISIGMDSPVAASVWAVVSVIATGGALRQAQGTRDVAPLVHRFGWLTMPLVWIGEAAVIGSLFADRISGGLIFATLAAIAYRRYELIYSIRLKGVAGPRSLLGADGRIVATVVFFAVGSLTGNPAVIDWGLVALAVETMAEAVLGTAIRWRPALRGNDSGTEAGTPAT